MSIFQRFKFTLIAILAVPVLLGVLAVFAFIYIIGDSNLILPIVASLTPFGYLLKNVLGGDAAATFISYLLYGLFIDWGRYLGRAELFVFILLALHATAAAVVIINS